MKRLLPIRYIHHIYEGYGWISALTLWPGKRLGWFEGKGFRVVDLQYHDCTVTGIR